jgi:hypothetical protein
MLTKEASRNDVIRAPLEVDGPALTGAQEWNPASLVRVGASLNPGTGDRWLTTTIHGLLDRVRGFNCPLAG